MWKIRLIYKYGLWFKFKIKCDIIEVIILGVRKEFIEVNMLNVFKLNNCFIFLRNKYIVRVIVIFRVLGVYKEIY